MNYFGIDKKLVFSTVSLMSMREENFCSMPAIGKFEVEGEHLLFYMMDIKDENKFLEPMVAGNINDELLKPMLENLENIEGRIVKVYNDFIIILATGETEEEREECLNEQLAEMYFDFKRIRTRKQLEKVIDKAMYTFY